MRGFKSIFVSSKHKIKCFLIQEKYFQTTNAVDTLTLSRVTHVLWPNFDVELKYHGYNTIKLNFIVTKSKSSTRSGQKRSKKVKFGIFEILKKLYVSDAE